MDGLWEEDAPRKREDEGEKNERGARRKDQQPAARSFPRYPLSLQARDQPSYADNSESIRALSGTDH